jgi:hypothetical protein
MDKNVFDMEVREAREAVEARSREVSEPQSNLAWNKSRVDEQSAQLRILKQQPSAFEEEVPTAEADAGATQQALRVTGNRPVDEPKLASSQHDEPSLLQAINQTPGTELEGLKAVLTRQESYMQTSKSTVRSSEEANRRRPEPENRLFASTART